MQGKYKNYNPIMHEINAIRKKFFVKGTMDGKMTYRGSANMKWKGIGIGADCKQDDLDKAHG